MDDEILDIVNSHDTVTGTLNRKDYAQFLKTGSGYIRASELFILNDKGKLWIPIRTAHKTIAPNGYDFSAAGHVTSGQDYLQAIIREVQEKINIAATPDQIEFVAKLKTNNIHYMRCIYILRSNTEPTFNPQDFVSASWLTPAELIANIDNGHPAKSDPRTAVVVVQSYLQD